MIEFWFDFSSPYAYFAAHDIEAVAARHGQRVLWRPFMLGAAFQVTGMGPLVNTPVRGDYARRDWERLARLMELPFELPSVHPINAIHPSRAFYWLEQSAPDQAAPFARAAFRAYFEQDVDLRDADRTADVAAEIGIDRAAILEGLASENMRRRFRAATEEALSKGVFGSPFFLVDGEPFWGWDRIGMIDAWLARGGW